MPIFQQFSLNDPRRWDEGDWSVASACTNCSAALQAVASAGTGYTHYISGIWVSSPSAALITITDGTSATIAQLYTTALGTPSSIVFPRGMELRCPNAGQNIKILESVSASINFLITGFKYPYIAQ